MADRATWNYVEQQAEKVDYDLYGKILNDLTGFTPEQSASAKVAVSHGKDGRGIVFHTNSPAPDRPTGQWHIWVFRTKDDYKSLYDSVADALSGKSVYNGPTFIVTLSESQAYYALLCMSHFKEDRFAANIALYWLG